MAELRSAGLLAGTVTVGQAFGGDLEAVSVHSGLLAARLALGADIAVVSQGPEISGPELGGVFRVEAGEVVNAAGTLGGRPVEVLHLGADERPPGTPITA